MVSKLVDEYIALIKSTELKRAEVSEDIKGFAAEKGSSLRSTRQTNLRLENRQELINQLESLVQSEKDYQFIENILHCSLYFIELDYDSPSLRKEEMSSWENKKFSTNELSISSKLWGRIRQRTRWMKMISRLVKNKTGYQEDRRDFHGIVLLNDLLTDYLQSKKVHTKPFVPVGYLLEQNRNREDVKIDSKFIICHIHYFLGLDSYKSEEAIRSIIRNHKNSMNSIPPHPEYLPNEAPLIESENILWELIYAKEKLGHTGLEEEIERLIVYFWRSSLIDQFEFINRPRIAQFICARFGQPPFYDETENIIHHFQTSIDLRNS